MSRSLQEFCIQKGIKQIWTTAYNPTGNGMAERLNQAIGLACRIYPTMKGRGLANYVQEGINNSWCSTIDYSPKEMKQGISIIDPLSRKVIVNMKELNQRIVEMKTKDLKTRNENRLSEYVYGIGDLVFVEETIKTKGKPLRNGTFTNKKFKITLFLAFC